MRNASVMSRDGTQGTDRSRCAAEAGTGRPASSASCSANTCGSWVSSQTKPAAGAAASR